MTGVSRDTNRRWLALAVICAGELMIVLDGTIVTVALPQIKEGSGSPTPAWHGR